MLKSNGETDTERCAVCHQADMSLSQPKAELCLMCHSATLHSGAAEHLRADPAAVSAVMGARQRADAALPLSDTGGIYCGTCHFFHDPRVMTGETPLAQAWIPPRTGAAQAVRTAVEAQWGRVAQKYGEAEVGAKFATEETTALRLPIADGTLCRHCHGTLP